MVAMIVFGLGVTSCAPAIQGQSRVFQSQLRLKSIVRNRKGDWMCPTWERTQRHTANRYQTWLVGMTPSAVTIIYCGYLPHVSGNHFCPLYSISKTKRPEDRVTLLMMSYLFEGNCELIHDLKIPNIIHIRIWDVKHSIALQCSLEFVELGGNTAAYMTSHRRE